MQCTNEDGLTTVWWADAGLVWKDEGQASRRDTHTHTHREREREREAEREGGTDGGTAQAEGTGLPPLFVVVVL